MIEKVLILKNKLKESSSWSCISFYSLCIALALVPFNAYYLKRFVYLAVFACLISRSIARTKAKQKFFTKHFMNKAWFIFLGAMFVSVIFSNDLSDSVSYFFERILVYAAMFWVVKETVINKSRVKFMIAVIVFTALVVGLDALWQFFVGKDIFFGFKKSDGGRALTGPFGMHNFFSGYLEMLVPFTAVLVFRKFKLSNWFVILTALLMFFSLIFNYQRATLLAAIISTACAIVVVNKKNLVAVALIPLIALVFLPGGFKERFVKSFVVQRSEGVNVNSGELWATVNNEKIDDELKYIVARQRRPMLGILKPGWDNGRIPMWRSAVHLFRKSSLVGNGLNAFERFANDHKELNLASIHAHNTYLQLMAETGIIGLLAFIFLLFIYFKNSIRYLKSEKSSNRVILIATCAAISTSLMIAVIANNMIAGQGLPLIFWTLMAFSSNIVAGNVEAIDEE